jgi:hypothetical protein
MGSRISGGFEHPTIADLSRKDKDSFAWRWCAFTERAERREAATKELIRDIHSSDRIERLTGNPMLLTTMALVKRKIGRFPQRRAELYEKAVEVLLNWRSEVDQPLDRREALPQLEYLAYVMCERGLQQLREDQCLDILSGIREEYPQLHPIKNHSPEDFLKLLERRTGLLIQSGHLRHDGATVPVYEFRHQTFQEYLAGLALVQGHFPGRDHTRTLAENVAPLAGLVEEWSSKARRRARRKSRRKLHGAKAWHGLPRQKPPETSVRESWREALRLCVSACNDDDVDATLRAISAPCPGEVDTDRPRAVLAALCLADEPNASDDIALEIVENLVNRIGDQDGLGATTSLVAAAEEIGGSRWGDSLVARLADEYFSVTDGDRSNLGGLCGAVLGARAPSDHAAFLTWLALQLDAIQSGSEREAALSALAVMNRAWSGRDCRVHGLTMALINRLTNSAPVAHASAWALRWMNQGPDNSHAWRPSRPEVERLLKACADPYFDAGAMYFIARIFMREPRSEAVDLLMTQMHSNSALTRRAVIAALIGIGSPRALQNLLVLLRDGTVDTRIRTAIAEAFGWARTLQATEQLYACFKDVRESHSLRRVAALALARISGSQVDWRQWLSSGQPSTRRIALEVLAISGPKPRYRRLLTKEQSGNQYLDPLKPIPRTEIDEAARRLKLPAHLVRERFETLSKRFGLVLEWHQRDQAGADMAN